MYSHADVWDYADAPSRNPHFHDYNYTGGPYHGERGRDARVRRAMIASDQDTKRAITRFKRDHSQDDIVSCVVRWVNSIAPEGAPFLTDLPRGDVSNPESCPIAMALSYVFSPGYSDDNDDWFTYHSEVEVNGGSTVVVDGDEIPAPVCSMAFVSIFDDGDLPQYMTPQFDDGEY
jgi:hypothetical protein